MVSGCYLDKTYCISPNCKGECGSELTDEIKEAIERAGPSRVAYSYFCGEPEETE